MSHPTKIDSRKTFPAKFARRAQWLHVVVCNAIPLVGTVVAIIRIRHVALSWFDIFLAVGMWAWTLGFGGTVGFHRLFAHGAFKTSFTLKAIFAIAGSMSGQGPPLAWVSTHRRHHECSDQDGDPHSPNLTGNSVIQKAIGIWHAHCGWLIGHDIPNPHHYCPDLVRDRPLMFINRFYFVWVALGLAIPAVLSGLWYGSIQGMVTGLLWGGFVRMTLTSQFIWSVNSLCHAVGARPHDTREQSANIASLAIPSFGESWHNNHHAYPFSARFGLRWWQLDLGYLLIAGMEACRLVWSVRRPEQTPSIRLENELCQR